MEAEYKQKESVSSEGPVPVVKQVDSGALLALSWSHIGSAHIDLGLPNQDAADILTDDGMILVSVADGLGSCKFSHDGAQATAKQTILKMKEFMLDKGFTTKRTIEDRELLRFKRPFRSKTSYKLIEEREKDESVRAPLSDMESDVLKEGFVKTIEAIRDELDIMASKTPLSKTPDKAVIPTANVRLSDKQAVEQYTKADFATTCLFAVTDGAHAFCSHIGDGGIYLVRESGADLLLEPSKGSTITETAPITLENWQEYLEQKHFALPNDAVFICLMTDGFAEPIAKASPDVFFKRMLSEARAKTREEFGEWLQELNDYYEDKGFSSDDKTVAFVFLKDVFRAK